MQSFHVKLPILVASFETPDRPLITGLPGPTYIHTFLTLFEGKSVTAVHFRLSKEGCNQGNYCTIWVSYKPCAKPC